MYCHFEQSNIPAKIMLLQSVQTAKCHKKLIRRSRSEKKKPKQASHYNERMTDRLCVRYIESRL